MYLKLKGKHHTGKYIKNTTATVCKDFTGSGFFLKSRFKFTEMGEALRQQTTHIQGNPKGTQREKMLISFNNQRNAK